VVWFSKQSEGGKLNFTKFETAKIDQCLGFIQGLLADRGDEKDVGGLRIKGTDYNNVLHFGIMFLMHLTEYVFSDRWRISQVLW
jgi:hypothetical protein